MCNLYDIGVGRRASASKWAEIVKRGLTQLAKCLNIRRTDPGMTLRMVNGEPSVSVMRWGIDMGHRSPTNNSRADKLKSVWREPFNSRRCVIPMTAFYEWSGKRTYAIRDPGEMMWAAGLWQISPEHGDCYSMITTAAAPWFVEIHTRMPAILREEDLEPFLEGEDPAQFIEPWAEPLDVMHCENPLTMKEPSEPKPVSQMDLFG